MIREPRLSILQVLALIALLGLVQKFELQPSPNKVELLENRNFTMKRVSDIQSVQLLLHDTALIHEKKFQGLVRPPDYLGASCHHLTTYWECRDCGEDGLFQDWEQCPIMLSQRGGCDFEIAVKAKDEDSKAVFSSFYEFEHAERNRLKHFGLAHDFEQMPCGAIEDCVTLQKCTNGLTLYVYEESGRAYIQALLASTIQNVTIVTEPEQACLLLVSCDGLNPPQDLTENFKWNGGRNHLIWQAHRCWPEQNHPDRPFPTSWNYGMAAIASASLMYTNLRRHYDVSLPLFTNPDYIFTISKAELVKSSSSNSRPLLLVLKCNMYDWEQVWWQYRWLAYKYWAKASDVIVDAKCPEKGKTTYDEDYPYNYTQLLLNSKFAFCPGGGAVSSYRFAEALGLGAIPVLTPEVPDPLDLDWSGCFIRVSVSRIADLPRLLRNISKEEIGSRQVQCKSLFDRTIGWNEAADPDHVAFDLQQLFLATIHIWWVRVQGALLKSKWHNNFLFNGANVQPTNARRTRGGQV